MVLASAVDIVEPFDIIFFDIVTVLNFDNLKKYISRIFKAVL